jgi:hypothetical protein
MSQHLITEFINRTYVFKPFHDYKIVNHSIKKYQGSNRKNNISPAMNAQSTHLPPKAVVNSIKEDTAPEKEGGEDKHIDITV